jgi:hypothetical protein
MIVGRLRVTYPIPYYSIIPPNPSHPIPSHPIPSHPIPSHPILSYPIIFQSTMLDCSQEFPLFVFIIVGNNFLCFSCHCPLKLKGLNVLFTTCAHNVKPKEKMNIIIIIIKHFICYNDIDDYIKQRG